MSRIRGSQRRRHLAEGVESALMVGLAALVVINGSVAVGGILAGIGRMFLIMLGG